MDFEALSSCEWLGLHTDTICRDCSKKMGTKKAPKKGYYAICGNLMIIVLKCHILFNSPLQESLSELLRHIGGISFL